MVGQALKELTQLLRRKASLKQSARVVSNATCKKVRVSDSLCLGGTNLSVEPRKKKVDNRQPVLSDEIKDSIMTRLSTGRVEHHPPNRHGVYARMHNGLAEYISVTKRPQAHLTLLHTAHLRNNREVCALRCALIKKHGAKCNKKKKFFKYAAKGRDFTHYVYKLTNQGGSHFIGVAKNVSSAYQRFVFRQGGTRNAAGIIRCVSIKTGDTRRRAEKVRTTEVAAAVARGESLLNKFRGFTHLVFWTTNHKVPLVFAPTLEDAQDQLKRRGIKETPHYLHAVKLPKHVEGGLSLDAMSWRSEPYFIYEVIERNDPSNRVSVGITKMIKSAKYELQKAGMLTKSRKMRVIDTVHLKEDDVVSYRKQLKKKEMTYPMELPENVQHSYKTEVAETETADTTAVAKRTLTYYACAVVDPDGNRVFISVAMSTRVARDHLKSRGILTAERRFVVLQRCEVDAGNAKREATNLRTALMRESLSAGHKLYNVRSALVPQVDENTHYVYEVVERDSGDPVYLGITRVTNSVKGTLTKRGILTPERDLRVVKHVKFSSVKEMHKLRADLINEREVNGRTLLNHRRETLAMRRAREGTTHFVWEMHNTSGEPIFIGVTKTKPSGKNVRIVNEVQVRSAEERERLTRSLIQESEESGIPLHNRRGNFGSEPDRPVRAIQKCAKKRSKAKRDAVAQAKGKWLARNNVVAARFHEHYGSLLERERIGPAPSYTDNGVIYALVSEAGHVLYVGQTYQTSIERAMRHFSISSHHSRRLKHLLSRVHRAQVLNGAPLHVVTLEKIAGSEEMNVPKFREAATERERFYINLFTPQLNMTFRVAQA